MIKFILNLKIKLILRNCIAFLMLLKLSNSIEATV